MKNTSIKPAVKLSDAEIQKLLYDLETHKAEVDLQNKSLIEAKELADIATTKFKELYDFAPTGYFTLTKKGEIIDVNICGAEILGQERNSLTKKRFGIFIPENVRPIFNQFLSCIFEGNLKETCELKLQSENGQDKYIRLDGHFKEGDEYCMVSAIDFTHQKNIRDALRISEEHFRELTESITDVFFELDHDLKYTYWNRASEKFTGIRAEKALGKTLWDLFTDTPDIKKAEAIYRKVLETKEPEVFESFYRNEAGTTVFEISVYPTIHGITVFTKDITSRKRYDEKLKQTSAELRKTNMEKDKFFSILAHDLRGPFNTFLGFTEIMAEDLPTLSNDEIQHMSASMSKTAKNLYLLLENILQWSRNQLGMTTYEPQSLMLMPYLQERIQPILLLADKKQIMIEYDIPDDLQVYADANMIISTINNLVTNAIKFTPRGGRIIINGIKEPDSVRISILNNGIGMNREQVEKLFHLQDQPNRKGTEGEPSTGLGLLICKDFVEKHGGRIWVESEEGAGSTFHFTLPHRT